MARNIDSLVELLTQNNCIFQSVLDVGCGVDAFDLCNLASIYNLRDQFNTKYFKGIDKYCGDRKDMIITFINAGCTGTQIDLLNNENLVFDKVDISIIPTLPSGFYDLIVFSNVLHFLERNIAAIVYNKLKDCLNPGGYIFIKLISKNHGGENESSKYKWSASEDELIRFAGLRIIDSGEGRNNSFVLVRK